MHTHTPIYRETWKSYDKDISNLSQTGSINDIGVIGKLPKNT